MNVPAEHRRIRLVVVDDHAIVRRGLVDLFATADDIELVATADDGDEALAVVIEHRPDVVLMDLSMARMDGAAATAEILKALPDTRVVALTSFGEEARIIEALDAGASGYLLKHIDPDDLIDAVRAAANGESPLDPRVGRVLLDRHLSPASPSRVGRGADLTARELEVLGLVGEGMANKLIARRLNITERTVKAHLTRVFQRIGVSDRVQAALWAKEHLG